MMSNRDLAARTLRELIGKAQDVDAAGQSRRAPLMRIMKLVYSVKKLLKKYG